MARVDGILQHTRRGKMADRNAAREKDSGKKNRYSLCLPAGRRALVAMTGLRPPRGRGSVSVVISSHIIPSRRTDGMFQMHPRPLPLTLGDTNRQGTLKRTRIPRTLIPFFSRSRTPARILSLRVDLARSSTIRRRKMNLDGKWNRDSL